MVGVRLILAWVSLLCGIVFFAPLVISTAWPPPATAEPDPSPTYAAIAGGVFLVISVYMFRERPLPPLEDE